MSNDDDARGNAGHGGWQPTPQGEYDADATAFVQIPEGFGLADFEDGASPGAPLAAPGGYVPPQIAVTGGAATDPAATGTFVMPAMDASGAQDREHDHGHGGGGQAVQWPEPNAPQPPAPGPPDPGATGQWSFTEAAAYGQGAQPYGQQSYEQQPYEQGTPPYEQQRHEQGAQPYGPYEGDSYEGRGADGYDGYDGRGTDSYDGGAAGHGYQDASAQANVTGQWSIPLAGGDLPDESGEFTQSALIEQWGGNAPATLPGGAPAPWAQQQAKAAEAPPEPEAAPAPESVPEPEPEPAPAVETEAAAPSAEQPEGEPEASSEDDVQAEAQAAPESELQATTESEPQPAPASEPQSAPAAGTVAESAAGTVAESAAETAALSAAEPGAEAVTGAGVGTVTGAEAGTGAGTEVEAGTGTEAEAAGAETSAAFHDEHPLVSYVLRVNGADRPVTDAWIGESLLYVLRERLGLAGAKDGCSQGECGACAVQVDGRLVASCLVPAATAAGSEVRTVEGLATDGQPSDVQRALAAGGAVQCGFCVPGMAMTVHDLLEGNPAPSERETRQALCGNLCRCSGYRGVLDAVQDVVAERRASATAADGSGDGADETARIPHQAAPGAGGVNPQHYPQDGGPA
ncbi:2Fe-2S iron-sulfur cluster-binding protein [Streptomyces monticola]|uniref:2Fe-2S iron-sulfur cluster-binding protein n=1 Tax=Streptomyces monticola TaxID=2666263 RepID=A0ABW2JWQ9_9ACTN